MFKGLHTITVHARDVQVKEKFHKKLAKLLEEELVKRQISAKPVGQTLGRWECPKETDKDIMWPPIVMIMNTQHEKDLNNKVCHLVEFSRY